MNVFELESNRKADFYSKHAEKFMEIQLMDLIHQFLHPKCDYESN